MAAFVSPEYRPKGVVIADPRNMHKEDVEAFLRHIYTKQQKDGPASAFRFKVFINRKDSSQKKAIYLDANNTDRKKSNRKQKKNMQSTRSAGHIAPNRSVAEPDENATSNPTGNKEKSINPLYVLAVTDSRSMPINNQTPNSPHKQPITTRSASIMPLIEPDENERSNQPNSPHMQPITTRSASHIAPLIEPDENGTSITGNKQKSINLDHQTLPTALQSNKPKQRKVINSDALAAEEAKRLGVQTTGTRPKRNRARAS